MRQLTGNGVRPRPARRDETPRRGRGRSRCRTRGRVALDEDSPAVGALPAD